METNELIKRSLATVSNTMDMIEFSQEAIARSRTLLVGAHGPIVQNRRQIVADIGEPKIGAINTESPFRNVCYIVVVGKAPSVFQLLVLNQRKKVIKLTTMFMPNTRLRLTVRTSSVVVFQ